MSKPPFLMVPHALLDHPAYLELGHSAARVLILLWRAFNGRNNGNLWLSYRDGRKRIGISTDAMAASFVQLQAHGLIVRTSQNHYQRRRATTWRLTMIANPGQKPTNEWTRWRSGTDLTAPEVPPAPDNVIQLRAAE